MLPKGMHQIARIELQKCIFSASEGDTSPQTPPVHASTERGAGALLWSLPVQHPRGKTVLDLPLFITCTSYVRPN